MNILFVLGFPNPFPGAAWTRIDFFSREWSTRGHHVEVLGIFSPKSLGKKGKLEAEGVNILNLIFNISINNPLVFTINFLISFVVSTIFLVARKPDVVIVSVPTGDVGLGSILASIYLKRGVVVDYRDEWEDYTQTIIKSSYSKAFYRFIKKIATYLYAGSSLVVSTTPRFIENLKLRGVGNIECIPNGADIEVFKPYGKIKVRRKLGFDNDRFMVVYSGIIGAYYKLDFLVRAIAKLISDKKLENNVHLIMVGKGPGVEGVLRLAGELGVKKNIVYLGVKNEPIEVAKILSCADVGIIPGIYSNGQLPVKLFEYCACELPVVATVPLNSALANLIQKHELGDVVSSSDFSTFAEVLEKYHENDRFRREVGSAARQFVVQYFDRKKIAENFLNLIKNLVED